MKNRKGFGKINIDGKIFLFNWADNPDGPTLIMYDENDKKILIKYEMWHKIPDSEEYKSKLDYALGQVWANWHGKHKKGPEWGGWGKRQAREMYRKYKTINLTYEQS